MKETRLNIICEFDLDQTNFVQSEKIQEENQKEFFEESADLIEVVD
jgi:hypothetical protein